MPTAQRKDNLDPFPLQHASDNPTTVNHTHDRASFDVLKKTMLVILYDTS
jgi:hypothetical protein